MSAEEIQRKLEEVLLKVQKPGRYVGGEYNAVIKTISDEMIRIALAFPDIYDLGVPNLGLSIFYDQLNRMPNVWAERTYVPWEDMEQEMRTNQIPLYTLESKTPVSQMDILAITIPYESLYTNGLNMIDLSGMPVLASERDERYPLILAGGHSAFNPEPMSAFIDAFVIGEGEELFSEVIQVCQIWKKENGSKTNLLERLAEIEGIYIPTFYLPEYHTDGTIKSILPIDPKHKPRIKKRIVPVLPPPPENFIVPSIDVVQNRVAVEIMRGCTRGCRFCQAGFITRPVRERPAEEIIQAIQNALDKTGYEEVALLSLSSSDYTQIQQLVDQLRQIYQKRKLNVSLPSLRIETISVEILEKLRGSRFSGFTLAPEAASEKIKGTINKPISESQLLETAEVIYSRGWQTIKLYFMIGLPGETIEDVEAICDLCLKVIKVGRKQIGKRSQLNLGIATFVPKPHTPFQWCKVDELDSISEKQALLRKKLYTPGIKINWSEPDTTMFEAWSARGDRRQSAVIKRAWELGARFDAWQDHFNKQAWLQAFAENNLDPEFYMRRDRKPDEVFPWDHIDIGVSKRVLWQEYQNSINGVLRADCREGCYGCGINRTFSDVQPPAAGRRWFCPIIEAEGGQLQ